MSDKVTSDKITTPCLNGCVGHDPEKIRLVLIPPPPPRKNVWIVNLFGDAPQSS